jgi:hypothetical protein
VAGTADSSLAFAAFRGCKRFGMTKVAAGAGNNGRAKSNSPPCLCKKRRDKDGAPAYLVVYACA